MPYMALYPLCRSPHAPLFCGREASAHLVAASGALVAAGGLVAAAALPGPAPPGAARRRGEGIVGLISVVVLWAAILILILFPCFFSCLLVSDCVCVCGLFCLDPVFLA